MCVKAPFEQQKLSEPVHRNVVNANLLQHEVRGRRWHGPQTQQEVVTHVRSQTYPENLLEKKHARKHNELECRLNIMHIPKTAEKQKVADRVASCTAFQPPA